MKCSNVTYDAARRGVTLTELVVACTLLASSMTVVLPMTFRLVRIRQTTQESLLAQQELDNQMGFLTALPHGRLEPAAAALVLHPSTAAQLNDARLTARVSKGSPNSEEAGYRIRIELTWKNALGHPSAPHRLTAWVYPRRNDRTFTLPADEAAP